MAKVPPKHARDQFQDFEGLLNNLQDWELSFKDKDKRLKSQFVGKDKLDLPAQRHSMNSASQHSNGTGVNEKPPMGKTTALDNLGSGRQYDYMKDYDAIHRLSDGLMEEEAVDANSEKELGNEFFKQKKFNEAIDCYSRSIAFSPTAVAYANRAMAYIKIKRFQEAENDCTEALNLDDRYIKAYSRRSTARKELGKLKESIDDTSFALRLDPHNQEIKKQYAELKSLLEKEILKKASGVAGGSSQGVQREGKLKVEKSKSIHKVQSVSPSSPAGVAEVLKDNSKDREGGAETSMEVESSRLRTHRADMNTSFGNIEHKNGEQELKASVQELAARAANLAKAEAAKNISPPNSAYQFEVSWRGLSGDRTLQAHLLKVTPATALPGIFKNALSAPMLVDVIRCIATFFTEDMDLGVKYLENLTKVPRFDMVIMCLSPSDKADLWKIWDEVFSKGTSEYAENLGNLRLKYGVKQ
ncbi:RNA polymerase II-associated protein 3 isoform X2 [Olea europaea var. sylvestris]|uniref:RNA polymerase II-associated protein 3 isoform X2 n=1 Tax=Olea europaea var. sylvestris TaxID=158386 RepID=UPI000C1D8576|nr:RNA polymerase II-associated protein 3 isoform X2 [Olea europaea var. sylvestris]